jgi:hypothetical protein
MLRNKNLLFPSTVPLAAGPSSAFMSPGSNAALRVQFLLPPTEAYLPKLILINAVIISLDTFVIFME